MLEIRMPEFSADLVEADLIDWLVKPGDRVNEGDLIAEFETDKATVEFESPVSGVVRELCVEAGTRAIRVGTLLARLEGEAGADDDADERSGAATEIEPEPAVTAAETEPAPAVPESTRPAPAPDPAPPAESGSRASALARRVASLEGVDLASVEGSGVGGRIVKADVEARVAPAKESAQSEAPAATSAPTAEGELVAHSAMRRTIAARLSEAKREIPHFYLDVECEITPLLAARKRVNAEGDVKLSVNDFVLAATARALREIPAMNVSWTDEGMLHHASVDVAVAVATEGGLVTPIVRGADRLGLAGLAAQVRELAERARARKLRPAEYQGGSFAVSNLGMYGIRSVYAIVNPPHAGILGVGAGEQRPIVREGELAVGTLMRCTLSADHRAVDGAVGAEWLAAFKRLIEDPMELLL